MQATVQAAFGILSRVLLSLVFVMSAVGHKIPNFEGVARYMGSEGVPYPQFLLAGAIVFLLFGSASIILGYHVRFGASLLIVFLVLATYFFHDFWTVTDPHAQQEQLIHFMKNLALIGAMLFIATNGAGAGSLDARLAHVPGR
jgi:putative oxidoreductase